tara:strand:+ start:3797 stop:5962 length:2166 start_codon:yes stop_codon:yes gene_type:complete
MASKKNTHEELIKQINVRTEFADKLYKKMRSERYGMTYCCPLELEKINLTNDLCNWEHSKIPKLPEAYSKEILKDPSYECIAPAVYNAVTGMCESSSPSTEVGSISFTYSDAIPNGTATAVEPLNEFIFGRDCPIYAGNPSGVLNGAGSMSELIENPYGTNAAGGPSWWVTYDATPSGPIAQQIPGVTEVSFVNALAKAPPSGWPTATLTNLFPKLSYTVPVLNNTSTVQTIHVFIASKSAFGLKLNGVTKIEPINISTPTNSLYSGGNFSGLKTLINGSVGLQTNSTLNDLVAITGTDPDVPAAGKLCNILVATNPIGLNNPVANDWSASPYTRGFIYSLRIDTGCNDVEISSWSNSGDGMLAFSIFSWEGPAGLAQGKDEIVASTQRSDLKELASSDNINSYYSDISTTTPYTCEAPAVFIAAAGNSCATCQTEVNNFSYECPTGYVLQPGNPPTCKLIEPLCDTETLVITVVNQNGEIIPYYDVIFDGGNYTTDINGVVIIVVEDASVNTLHTFNLCECLTTSGGCAVQTVKITVTDPDVVDCVPNTGLPCLCVSPSFYSEVVNANGTVVITFVDSNYASSTTITAVTYTLAYKNTTDTIFTEVVGLTANAFGKIIYTFTGLASASYEYKIKSVCVDESSSFSATNPFTVEDIAQGCMDPSAANYDPDALQDNGSCQWYGCTDSSYSNFIAPAGPWTNPATGITGIVISNGDCNNEPQ